MEEVAKYHATTLAAVVERFNNDVASAVECDERAAEVQAKAEADHRRHVEEIAGDIQFK